MRSLSLFFIFSILANFIYSQSSDECKYSMTIAYLRTNIQINERIKLFFRKEVSKKDKYVDFNLSDRIDFFPISYFQEQLNTKDYGIDKELINDSKMYYDRYYFKSFSSEFLSKIKSPNESKLFLTFSKPVGDHLVVELRNYNPALDGNRKFGKAMLIFIRFGSDGIIEDALFSGATYN
jgi:hypothetical protein